MGKIVDYVGDILKRFKQLKINDDENHKDVVVRNLAVGMPAGSKDFKNYERW